MVARGTPSSSFSENVEMAETSYQMLVVLSFCDRERVQPPSLKVTVLTFPVKNSLYFENTRKKPLVTSRTLSRPRP